MKAGFAIEQLPNPIGVELTGYGRMHRQNKTCSDVLDPLFARVLLLEAADILVVIASLDLCGIDFEIVNQSKRSIDQRLGIPPDNIVLSCTHTHHAPATISFNTIGVRNETYSTKISGTLLSATAEAADNLRNAEASYSIGSVRIGENRRKVGGPYDPEVPVLSVESSSGKVILFQHGCHPVAYNSQEPRATADYPGAATRFIENSLGNCHAMFVNGAAGEIDPRHARNGSLKQVEEIGRLLGAEVLRALPSSRRINVEKIEVSNPIEKEVEPDQRSGLWKDKRSLRLRSIFIGPLAVLPLPFEPFVETLTSIKRYRPPVTCWPIGYSDGTFGYLHTATAHNECKNGQASCYEVELAQLIYGWSLSPETEFFVREKFRQLLL